MSSVRTERGPEFTTVLASSRRPRPFMTTLVLWLGDVLAIVLASEIAIQLALVFNQPTALQLWHIIAFVVAVPAAFLFSDLYPAAGVSPVDELRLIFLVLTTITLIFIVAGVAQGVGVVGLLQLLVAYLTMLVLMVEVRILLREALSSQAWWGVPAVVLGGGKTRSEEHT